MLGTKEHYEVIEFFERSNPGRNDKEPKELWKKGQVFQDGMRNQQFNIFLSGYMLAKSTYQAA